jgi:alanine dehydrogenase
LLAGKDAFYELSEVITGRKRARRRDSDITVFDSTGLAIQDVATANMVYQKALAGKTGVKLQQF